ncbi:hypothetical protein [Bifidobacterium biavatii]|uniref:Uncharacterized protein n=1 Tax=Bifidobacterium biavatii DSM 23969 TaxID=1437608 RepID=A0A086ZYY2_9BIFI|nr:hypothetical protein [Bifidobacterium biavatii]KFI51732.1 hypothetical protein BBIA_0646 [Bifidobacterium biavatii DSM 23969]
MTNYDYLDVANTLAKNTRDLQLTTKTPRSSIAEAVGLNRGTISKYLDHSGGDMPLNVFIATQDLAGGDPIAALADALVTYGIGQHHTNNNTSEEAA